MPEKRRGSAKIHRIGFGALLTSSARLLLPISKIIQSFQNLPSTFYLVFFRAQYVTCCSGVTYLAVDMYKRF